MSISLPQGLLDELDRIPETGAFSGRSQVVRAALQPFLAEARRDAEREGAATATMTLCYDEGIGDTISQLRHAHSTVIKTMVHGHTDDHGCLEIIVLEGAAGRIRALHESVQGRKGVRLVELVWLDCCTPSHQGDHDHP